MNKFFFATTLVCAALAGCDDDRVQPQRPGTPRGQMTPRLPSGNGNVLNSPCSAPGGAVMAEAPYEAGTDYLGGYANANLIGSSQRNDTLHIETYDTVAELNFSVKEGDLNAAYETCNFCLYLNLDDGQNGEFRRMMGVSYEVALTAFQLGWDDPNAGGMSGTIRNVQFREQVRNQETNQWEFVENGCTLTMAEYALNSVWMPFWEFLPGGDTGLAGL